MDFHNKLGTDASIGLVNMHKDLVKFELCYKGRINYNVNMMKVRVTITKLMQIPYY